MEILKPNQPPFEVPLSARQARLSLSAQEHQVCVRKRCDDGTLFNGEVLVSCLWYW
jgi:hypothetical protein